MIPINLQLSSERILLVYYICNASYLNNIFKSENIIPIFYCNNCLICGFERKALMLKRKKERRNKEINKEINENRNSREYDVFEL